MIFRNICSFFLLLLLITGCGQANPEEEPEEEVLAASPEIAAQDSLWKEVMIIHDAVMPKISDINKISRALKTQLEENPDLDDQTKSLIAGMLDSLTMADEAMWDWMHNLKKLKPLRSTMSHTEILEYLEKEKIAIAEVKDLMLNSIDNGNALLEKLENDAQNH